MKPIPHAVFIVRRGEFIAGEHSADPGAGKQAIRAHVISSRDRRVTGSPFPVINVRGRLRRCSGPR